MKIKAMVKENYVPIAKSRLYTMYKSYCLTGEAPKEWHTKGRPPIVSVKDLNVQVDAHHESLGQSATAKNINQFL